HAEYGTQYSARRSAAGPPVNRSPARVNKAFGTAHWRRFWGYTRGMHDTRTGSGLLRLAWQRALDGDRRWGSIDIRPDRFGVTRYRLVVFPPGITDAERRRVRVARGWLLWGALVWVFCEILLNQMTGPWTALV